MPYKSKEKKRKHNKEYRQKNKEKEKEYQKKYYQKNKEKRKENNQKNKEKIAERYKKWCKENKEKRKKYCREYQREYQKNRIKTDIKFRLDKNIRTSICMCLKGKKAGRKWESLVGYNVDNLMQHLESKFENWMNWDNYGTWHIDHIKPKSLFNYESPEDEEFKKCWALDNLQPLEAIENIKKSNFYPTWCFK